MAEIVQTPTLYDFYGKLYDYNTLAQAADAGLLDYLGTLNRGNKDEKLFRDAYANMMSGIKDGSITFTDGHFHDKLGRYTNADKKDRDYYGLVANYIYGKMGKSDPYKKPEDKTKIKWDSNSVRTALMRELFNSDNGNIQDFLDLDKETNGVRAITNRANYLANAFQNIANNWDSRFEGYSDAEKANYLTLLGNAATALRDGRIDAGDYLALSKAVGGLDFRSMLATGTPTTTSSATPSTTNSSSTSSTASSTSSNALTTDYTQGTSLQTTQPTKLKHASLLHGYNSQMMSKLTSGMNRLQAPTLINILRNVTLNKYYKLGNDSIISTVFGTSNIDSKAGVTAVLNALGAKGGLKRADPNNSNLFYITGLRTKKGTGFVWDKASNTLTEMELSKIPYAKAKLGGTKAMRKGGILKAADGAAAPQWYDGLDPFTYTDQLHANWGNTLYGMRNTGQYDTAYGTQGIGSVKPRYRTDAGFSDYSLKGKDYATGVENQQYYKNFTNSVIDSYNTYKNTLDKSTLNDDNNLFLRYAHLTDKMLPTGSEASFFDNNGNLRSSWTVKNNDSYGRSPHSTFTDAGEYLKAMRNDLLLSVRHNDLLREGKRYFYTNKDGLKVYVDPTVATSGKYNVSTNGIKSRDGITDWTDYEITGLLSNLPVSGTPTSEPVPTGEPVSSGDPLQQEGSDVNPEQEDKKSNTDYLGTAKNILNEAIPYAVGATRMGMSIRANNRIAKALHQDPVLHDPYELYSPVTGAFSEMQARNLQAADVRRQAAQPYTSDASLNAARSLDANRQAAELEHQGFLADDKEIKRTQQEALARQEANIKERNAVATWNRDSIAKTKYENGRTEAARLKSNWQSKDNFLQGIETDLKTAAALRKADKRAEEYQRRQGTALTVDDLEMMRPWAIQEQQLALRKQYDLEDLLQEISLKSAAWQKAHPDADVSDFYNSEEYQSFKKRLREIQESYMQQANDLASARSRAWSAWVNALKQGMNYQQWSEQNQLLVSNWNKPISARQGAKLLRLKQLDAYLKNGGRLRTNYLLNKVFNR